jgi:DNA-binding beta-propeller fold protein YncE
MIRPKTFAAGLVVLTFSGFLCGQAASPNKESAADLARAARVSLEQARATALAAVPGGRVKSEELEREKGRLVYSFDIQVGDKPGVEEVVVDATDGKILEKKHESPADEKAEAKKEKAGDYTVTTLALPGGGPAGIGMDYLGYDPATNSVWVPAGNTGAVDVVDASTRKVTQLSGFPSGEMGSGDRKRTVGPSSVTIGKGTVYIGDRFDSSVRALDSRTHAPGASVKLDSMPDGLAYVASTNEVWVTTPRDKTIRILDAATLTQKEKLTFEGNPEGFAVDGKRGRFYTNLEDKDVTLAIDVKSRKTVATWKPACGEDGPHGLRLEEKDGFLLVACSTKTEVLDAGRSGAVLSSVETGDGVDDLDYAPSRRTVYVGAARAGEMTVARLDSAGKLSVVSRVKTQVGARNGVVTRDGAVFLGHSGATKLSDLVVASPAKN